MSCGAAPVPIERKVSTATNPDIDAAGFTEAAQVDSVALAARAKPDDKLEGFSVVGKALPKPDSFAKVTGTANFADDIVLPRMLFGKVLRSKHAHALVKKIDCSRAPGRTSGRSDKLRRSDGGHPTARAERTAALEF